MEKRELEVRKQILEREIEDLKDFLNQTGLDADTKYFEKVLNEKRELLSKMEKGWLDYLNELTKEAM